MSQYDSAKMFMQIGSAEKAGSGVDKILAGWRFANWRAPMLRLLTQPDIVELTMMMESLMDDATKERLAQIFGPKSRQLGKNVCWHLMRLALMAMLLMRALELCWIFIKQRLLIC